MSIKNKYTPTSLDEVVYPDEVTKFRVESLADGSLKDHVIFYGPRGTAKTTTANLLAQTLRGEAGFIEKDFVTLLKNPDLFSHLQRSCQIASFSKGSKVVLLFNEFDKYKGPLFQFWTALDLLESSGLVLIITTNYEEKIDESILDRCLPIEFPKISAIGVLSRAQQILKSEGLELPDEQVLSYLKGQERWGSFRKYTNVIDQLLLMKASGLPFPQWSGQKPTLTVV